MTSCKNIPRRIEIIQKITATKNLTENKKKYSISQKIAHAKPEYKEKQSQVQKIAQNKLETKEKRSKSLTEYHSKPGAEENRSQSLKITNAKPEIKEKRSKAMTKSAARPEVKEKQRKASKESNSRPEVKEKLSIAGKRNWQNPEFIKKMEIRLSIRPNIPETFLMNFLNELFPNEWKYTGDFSFMINGKNPDFIHMDYKKCIEHYGHYWHQNDDPQTRINFFKNNGWDCLIVWQDELNDLITLKNKLLNFTKN